MKVRCKVIRVRRAFGPVVEGEALVFREGFSPRYDLDRTTGIITKIGHALEGAQLREKILIIPTAKGGVAAGWAFFDIKSRGFAPKALVFGKTNPVMVQGAVFANMTVTEGWAPSALDVIATGDIVRVNPAGQTIEVLRRAVANGPRDSGVRAGRMKEPPATETFSVGGAEEKRRRASAQLRVNCLE